MVTQSLYLRTCDEAGHKNYTVECFQDDAQYQKRLNSEEYQAFLKASDKLLTEKVDVELQPEFISTKPDKLNVSGENDYVVYMTEIGVQLGKGDEFANGVLKEMKAAVEKKQALW